MTVRIAITFGQKYNPRGSDERHPASPRITGSSYVVFEGPTREDARGAAVERLGNEWAFDYLLDEKFSEQIEQFALVEVKLPIRCHRYDPATTRTSNCIDTGYACGVCTHWVDGQGVEH